MTRSSKFPIVGIGASAGGIEALEGFFKHMPCDAGFGFVVVTHLSRDRESLLHEIVARFTEMPVEVAQDGMAVVPDKVFVLPGNSVILIDDGLLRVTRNSTSKPERRPIDLFFSSLAKDQGEYAAAVILSGGDGDGTLGIKAIKEREGVTLAQTADGSKPRHRDMPDSAILTGMIDFAVPVEQMPDKLLTFANGLKMLEGLPEQERAKLDRTFKTAQKEIYALLREQVGHDFSGYKPKTFSRRVLRRMHILQIETLDAYVERLRADPGEVAALFRDLLINVTDFFRDVEAFDELQKKVVAKLFEGRGIEETVRIWIPGCATGEEVYSIGILLREHMRTMRATPRVQIFATDIDERSLATARAARYPSTLLTAVAPERLERYFTKDGGAYVVSKEIRDLCIFSPHSVIRDPPFSRMDLVSCRNLLIYLDAEIQSQVLPTFHYSLRPSGYLFLGLSENVSQYPDLFDVVDRRHRIYQARRDVRVNPKVPTILSNLRSSLFPEPDPTRRSGSGVPLRHDVETQVMERFSPPHVVINAQGDAVYFSARTGKYLEAAAGAPSRQLIDMSRRGLRLELRSAIREAMETRHQAVREHITVEIDDGRVQLVTLVVDQLVQDGRHEPLFLVLFHDNGPALSREEATNRAQNHHDDSVAHLERELRDTRDRLQSLIEEYETALEELKSSNEELVSVNEELQSTNEELEASKEELQSLNEELQTVNAELGHKVDALDQSNADLRNLFDSTQIATVFLDRNLVIRNFTPPASDLFNILPSDKGRPITNFSSRLNYPELGGDIQKVLTHGTPIEKAVTREDSSSRYLARLRPYSARGGETVGVIIALVDVTELAQARIERDAKRAEFELRTDDLLGFIAIAVAEDPKVAAVPDGTMTTLNARLAQMGTLHDALLHRSEISVADLMRQCVEDIASLPVVGSGPEILLQPKQAFRVGLIFIEWATRYSSPNKSDATLEWSITRDQPSRLRIELRHRGTASKGADLASGVSENLMQRIATDLDGTLEIDIASETKVAVLSFEPRHS